MRHILTERVDFDLIRAGRDQMVGLVAAPGEASNFDLETLKWDGVATSRVVSTSAYLKGTVAALDPAVPGVSVCSACMHGTV